MPAASYETLLKETSPQVIETWKQYRTIGQRFGDLVGKGRSRTPEETKLMRLLGVLIQDYDRQHGMPPDDSTPAERPDLLPIFGQRSHVNEALTGKRAISAPQARKLGQVFLVDPGLFL